MEIIQIENLIKQMTAEEVELTHGEHVVISSYIHTKRYLDSSHIVVDQIIWEDSQEGFINMLNKCNVTEFIFADTSTAAMNTIIFLISEGFSVEETVTVEEKDGFGEPKKGLLMKAGL